MDLKPAMLYDKQGDGTVKCRLCAHGCRIRPGKLGICMVRENVDGALFSHAYNRVVSYNADPIEKKPLYHVLPGSSAFSVATLGCNFRCDFCQNWQISQIDEEISSRRLGYPMTPREIVDAARAEGCRSIAYTYTEPTIFFEYAYDTARIAHEEGLLNVFVTNGFMTRDALETIRPYLDACNVDLKSFRNEFYRRQCGGRLEPVLSSLPARRELGIWVEVTTLVIPGQNDSDEELDDIARFIGETDVNIPWHISRFHPDYKSTRSVPTPPATLEAAKACGEAHGLKYIYIGNVAGTGNTRCSSCGEILVHRSGWSHSLGNVSEGGCGKCGEPIPGIW